MAFEERQQSEGRCNSNQSEFECIQDDATRRRSPETNPPRSSISFLIDRIITADAL